MTRTRRNAESRRAGGFTLVEMIAVLVIIGLIVVVAIPQISNAIERARQTSAKAQTQQMLNGVERFNMDVSRYPTDEEGLMALLQRPAEADGWDGPYIRNWTLIPKDPWKGEYGYTLFTDDTGRDYPKVISLGKDKEPGGRGLNADIINGEVMEDADTGT